ncbi:MAG: hypothetical protein R3327_06710 [Nitrosopumilaceae archaeon]|nr:hypothetical protein [Nitrosopumilaceae archaeon]
MFQKYKDYLKLNKNILTAFVAAFVVSAIFAQSIAEQEDHLNTTYTTIVDFSVFFSTFAGMFYLDNRKKYRLESGQLDSPKLKHDLVRLVTSLGISEVVYTIVRWFFQYYFLTLQYDPYLASVISQSIATIVYMIVVNLSVKLTRLYKDGT